MNIAFITGISGQDGFYLTQLLLKKQYAVYGLVRRNSLLFTTTRLGKMQDKIKLFYGDLTDGSGMLNNINFIINHHSKIKQFEIYNLAAQSHVKISFETAEYTSQVNANGTLRLLEIISSLPPYIKKITKFYQAGTSEMFGKVLQIPQDENTPFNPQSPYAVSKLFSYHMVKIYRNSKNLFLTNGILFNHESPKRGYNFVTMKVINGIKDILSGKKKYIELGNLNSKRDWGHAKDYVKGMWLMLQHSKPDDFILATGKTNTVRSFVEKAFLYKGIKIHWVGEGIDEIGKDSQGNIRVKINPKFFRPCEVDLLLGNPTKAEETLEWKREYKTLDDIIIDLFQDKVAYFHKKLI